MNLNEYPQELQYLLERFAGLLTLAQEFSTNSFRMIGENVGSMSEIATQTRSLVEWELLILVPLVIFLALAFSVFIARPIRQIDEAIAQWPRQAFPSHSSQRATKPGLYW